MYYSDHMYGGINKSKDTVTINNKNNNNNNSDLFNHSIDQHILILRDQLNFLNESMLNITSDIEKDIQIQINYSKTSSLTNSTLSKKKITEYIELNKYCTSNLLRWRTMGSLAIESWTEAKCEHDKILHAISIMSIKLNETKKDMQFEFNKNENLQIEINKL